MNHQRDLIEKIKSGRAKIGIIGLGYVGLPLALRFHDEGFKVLGFDVDPRKIDLLQKGKGYIKHIPAARISALPKSKRFTPTGDFSRLSEADAIIICVPTPLDANKQPDMGYIRATTDSVAGHLRPGQIVSLESTTYPGTTREVLLPRFEMAGYKVGRDFFLVFSPEREDPGNPKFHTQNTPKVVGGITAACRAVGNVLYSRVVERVIAVSSPETAEMTKILENTFRSVNIALVNELKILADRMGLDIWEVIAAASSKPFGYMAFYPGPGLGGHCIPIDPFYLTWKAKEFNFNTRFIELAGEINTMMPEYVVTKLVEALNARGKCLRKAKVLVLGIAYKKDIDDMRESPAFEIIELLKARGAKIFYNDPFIPKIPKVRKYDLKLESSPLTPGLLRKMDAVVIVTDHSAYDYRKIIRNSNLVIDTRNACKGVKTGRRKIVKA